MAKAESKMNKAIAIFRLVYGDSSLDNNQVRKTCIERFQKELKMQPATASTYLAHVQKAVITAEQEGAMAKVEKALGNNKEPQVWTTYRTGRGDKSDVATLAGVFMSKKAAKEANELLRLPTGNIKKGVIEIGQTVAA
ncbi:MAG: hypothetical protein JXR12_06580 [Neptunomonas phycophila]|uniref:hypothetical protein n=1 Tax=Neptunomonas phycophila TaxID=1572645 RepID=UPI003B8D4EB4